MKYFLLSWIYLSILASNGLHSLQIQRFQIVPKSVQVPKYENVTLYCAVDFQQGNAQWTKDGFALGFQRDVPGYPRFKYSGDPSIGEHNLVITGIDLEDDGEYQCQVGPTDQAPPIWASANVTVLVPPQNISIVGWGDGARVEVMAGASLTLECLVYGSRPESNVVWYKSGVKLDSSLQYDEIEMPSPRLRNVRSRIMITATPHDNGQQYSCEGRHPAYKTTTAVLVASIELSVLHPPSSPIISGYKSSEVLVSGMRRVLSCAVQGGNPAPSVEWRKNSRLIDDVATKVENEWINTLDIEMTPDEDGATFQCQVLSDLLESPLSANVTMSVRYPPSSVSIIGPSSVTAEQKFDLLCESSSSNPPVTLYWSIEDKPAKGTPPTQRKGPTGGWIASSQLNNLELSSHSRSRVAVLCKAVSEALDVSIFEKKIINIIKPPGAPVLKGAIERSGKAGSVLPVSCVSIGGNPPPIIRLYKGDYPLSAESTTNGNVTEAIANVRLGPSDNRAIISCQILNEATNDVLKATALLSVFFGPTSVHSKTDPIVGDENQSMTLSCESSSSNPPANITWYSGDTVLDGASYQYADGINGGKISRSQLTIRVSANDNGRTYVCKASNGVSVSVSSNITTLVNHAPVWRIRPREKVDAIEGHDLIVNALAVAKPGPVSYIWTRGEEMLPSMENKLNLPKISRSDSGKYSVRAHSPRGSINASFTVNVQYGPEDIRAVERVTVGEGRAATIECTAEGNPIPEVTWHRSNSSAFRDLATGIGVARLVIEEATKGDTGIYFCSATNDVSRKRPPVATRVIVTHAAVLDVSGHDVVWAPVGHAATILCLARAAPPPSFEWTTEDGRTLVTDEKYSIGDSRLSDGLTLWTSELEIKRVNKLDYGLYRCTVDNDLGTDTGVVSLKPPVSPLTPVSLTVVTATSESLHLSWEKNARGSPALGYIIRYYVDGSNTFEYLEIPGGFTREATVTGLIAGQRYVASIQAMNTQGRSPYFVPPLIADLPDLPGDASSSSSTSTGTDSGFGESRVPRLLLLILMLTGAALLALNIAIIACFVRRRKRNQTLSNSSSKTTGLAGYGSTPTNTPGAHDSSEGLITLTPRSSSSTAHYSNYQVENSSQESIERTPLQDKQAKLQCTPPPNGHLPHSIHSPKGVPAESIPLDITWRGISEIPSQEDQLSLSSCHSGQARTLSLIRSPCDHRQQSSTFHIHSTAGGEQLKGDKLSSYSSLNPVGLCGGIGMDFHESRRCSSPGQSITVSTYATLGSRSRRPFAPLSSSTLQRPHVKESSFSQTPPLPLPEICQRDSTCKTLSSDVCHIQVRRGSLQKGDLYKSSPSHKSEMDHKIRSSSFRDEVSLNGPYLSDTDNPSVRLRTRTLPRKGPSPSCCSPPKEVTFKGCNSPIRCEKVDENPMTQLNTQGKSAEIGEMNPKTPENLAQNFMDGVHL